MADLDEPAPQDVLPNRYLVGEEISFTGTAVLVECVDTLNHNAPKVAKIQYTDHETPMLTEHRAYNAIFQSQMDPPGFCRRPAFGESLNRRFLIFEQLGNNPENRMAGPANALPTLPLPAVVEVGLRGLTALRTLHELDLLHQDIRPSNFLYGLPQTNRDNTSHLMNFGMTTRYMQNQNGQRRHVRPGRQKADVRVNLMFGSRLAVVRHKIGRQSDIESLIYVLVYLTRGFLPWQDLCVQDQDFNFANSRQEVANIKRRLRNNQNEREQLFQECPIQFRQMYELVINTRYSQRPDYDVLQNLLETIPV